jgi:catechol 2,3-dioxygenase-like lactoylglutathione lyase family enzyme
VASLLVHVGVRAKDLQRSLRFWRDALGLTTAATMDGCCDLSDGYHNFRIFQHAGPARAAHLGGMLDYLHIGVRVPDLSAAAARLQAAGFTIFWDGVDAGKPYDPATPPARSFKVEDPDGIVVDVTASADQWPGVTLQDRDTSSV